jgi:4-hydroxy-tetrahydrodipicolinate synthase
MDDRPRGAIAPVPTPLDAAGVFDPDALARHLAWLAAEGLDGALVLGTNGEFPSMSFAERLEITRAAANAGAGLQLLLGVGSCALPEALELVDEAARLGYRAVLCPPPFYYRSAPASGIAAFLAEVIRRSSIPVILYHIPQLTGVAVSDDVLAALDEERAGAAGVKDSTGSPAEMDRLLDSTVGAGYFVGHDALISRCLDRGGIGSISAAANVAPRLVAGVHQDAALQPRLDATRSLLESHGLAASVKALLSRAGVGLYRSRPPMEPLADDARDRLFVAWDALEG